MFCKNCGAEITGEENVCSQCGHPFDKEEPVMIMNDSTNESDNNMKNTQSITEPPVFNTNIGGSHEVINQPTTNQQIETPPVFNTNVGGSQEVINQPTMNQQIESPPVFNTNVGGSQEVINQPTTNQQIETPPVFNTNVGGSQEVMNQPTINQQIESPPIFNTTVNANQSVQQPQPTITPTQQTPQNNNKVRSTSTFLIIIIIAIVGIGAVILNTHRIDDNTQLQKTNNNQSTSNATDIESSKTITYDGYSFEIPNGYETSIEEQVLIISNYEIVFSIKLDHEMDYNKYKSSILELESITNYKEETISKRKYFLITYQNEGVNYISSLENTKTFIGAIVKIDRSDPVEEDYTVLTKILDSAKKIGDSTENSQTEKRVTPDSLISGIIYNNK